jgi:hypothetical protein
MSLDIQVHENGNPECTTHRVIAEDGTPGPWLPGDGTTLRWIEAGVALGATHIGFKIIDKAGKYRTSITLASPAHWLQAAALDRDTWADGGEVESWLYATRDGETVYVEPRAYQWQVRYPEFGAEPLPETFVIGQGGERVAVTL